MKKYLLLLAFAISGIASTAQDRCLVYFEYKAKINADFKVEKIGLPTVPFILSYLTKMDDDAFKVLSVSGSTISEKVAAHLGGDMCADNAEIIRSIYLKSPEGLLVRFFSDKKKPSGKPAKPIDVIIPLEDIKFSFTVSENKKMMVIDLGEVSLGN